MNKIIRFTKHSFLDFIPAFGGLIGKIALTSSFALVWAKELGISTPNFAFENVRMELLIGSIITLIAALIFHNIAPPGTLAPLIVLIPTMAAFGVHPFILSIMVGIIGIVFVKTKIFSKLITLAGHVCKTSLNLVFGISGVLLSAEKLLSFFGDKYIPLFLLVFSLALAYIILFKYKKIWMIIPFSAIASLILPLTFGIKINISSTTDPLNFNPFYWWNDMWGIGFGLDTITVLKTLPFAVFVMLLWAMDTVSINALIEANFKVDEKREKLNIDKSFIVVSVRNIIGGLCGGAQTGSLWRSFLIPLFMIKRPIRSAAVLLGILGIVASITSIPIKILSFPPLIWTVLLFGIFIPFVIVGIKAFKNTENIMQKGMVLLFTVAGVIFSPIFTWIGTVCFEKVERKFFEKKADKKK